MRRLWILTLTLLLLGCGGGGGQQQPAPAGGGQATGGTTETRPWRGAILYDQTNAYSEGLKDAITAEFTKLGGEIVETQAYSAGDSDFRSLLVKLKTARPDVIFLPGYATDTALIISQAKGENLAGPFIGGDGWDMPELLQKGGRAVEGTYFTTHYVETDPDPAVQAFVQRYAQKYNMAPDSIAALGYDVAMLLASALQRAGTTESEALRQAIAETKGFPGVCGAITLDERGDPQKGMVIIKIENGQRVLAARFNPDGTPATAGAAAVTGLQPMTDRQNLPDEVKVGHVVALTGEVASFGAATRNGIDLALEEINGNQLLGPGVRMTVVHQDDQSTPTGAANAAKKLIASDKVIALLGEVASKNSLAMAPIAEENKIPMISPSSTNPDVTASPWVFRACYLDTFQGQMIARFGLSLLRGEVAGEQAPPPSIDTGDEAPLDDAPAGPEVGGDASE